jgi:hypothetical protein
MKFSPGNHYDREYLLTQAGAHEAATYVTGGGHIDADEARRLAEQDRIIAAAMSGNFGIPVTESYLFGEMACAGCDEDQPPSILAAAWARICFWSRELVAFFMAPRPDLS